MPDDEPFVSDEGTDQPETQLQITSPETVRHARDISSFATEIIDRSSRRGWRDLGVNPDKDEAKEAFLADLRFLRALRSQVGSLAKNVWHLVIVAAIGFAFSWIGTHWK